MNACQRHVATWCLAALAVGCVTPERDAPPLSLPQITRLIRSDVRDSDGWARDIEAAITATERVPTAERVCAVIAVIEQESGYQVNPSVPNLPRIVRDGLKQKLSALGPLAGLAVKALLAGSAPGSKESFGERVDRLRSEKDLDQFFRDMAAAYRDKLPGPFVVASALDAFFGTGSIDNLNPVTTAGSMQVKVSYAREIDEWSNLSDGDVRDLLYTRTGGVRAGTARLLGYEADYDDVLYRFADYNAGVYASRNAAFQQRVAELTGRQLAFDGDIMAYEDDGDLKDEESQTLKAMLLFARTHDMWEWLVRRHARSEKTIDFENTYIWNAVSDAWTTKSGKPPVYARVPDLTLKSPKLSSNRSTSWFATSVKKRYQACRSRG